MTEWQYVIYFTLKVKQKARTIDNNVSLILSEQTFQSVVESRETSREHFVKVNYSPLEFIRPLKYLQIGR